MNVTGNGIVLTRAQHLDIMTPKGQETLRQEKVCAAIFEHYAAAWGLSYIRTKKDMPCRFDAYLVRDGEIVAAVEQKSRAMSRWQLARFKDEWLVTYDKILAASKHAAELYVPLLGFMYLIPDRLLLVVKLTDKHGNFMVDVRQQRSVTQRTCNGGKIERLNGYIPMATAYPMACPTLLPR